MYCPACDKEFSPVHSRCPECKGWLRVSGPTVGAKAGGSSAAPGIRPAAAPPSAPAAPSAQPLRPAAPAAAAQGVENLPTQKVAPVTGANVPLPSRPSAKLPTPSAPVSTPAQPPRPPAQPANPNDWAEQSESPSPVAGPATGARPPELMEGRGGLGTGWEASGSFQAPTQSWGAPAAATPGWNGPGVAGPTGVLGAVPPAPPTGWGAPAPAAGFGGGLGAGPASGSLGAPPAPGFGSSPPSGALGGGPGMGNPVSGGLNGGGGWLGDGGGGGSSFPSAATPKATGGWLGDGATNASAHGSEAAPLSMPAMAAPEVGSASDAPLLALPDHTVAVDLGTPWEEESGSTSSSNKMVYAVLTTVVLGLVGFFGYTHYQNQALKKPASPTSTSSPISSALTLGEDSLKKGKAAFKQKKWAEAVGHADTAHLLIKDLKTAPKERVKDVVKFHRDANLRYAGVTYQQANNALQSGDTNQALGLADKANSIYRKLSGTSKDQARAYAFQGKVYERIGDLVNAQSAYKKAASLSPGSGYEQQVSAMRRSQVTEVVQSAPQSAPQDAAPAQPQFVQPSLGDGPSVPTGRSGGGYRSSGSSAGSAPDAAPAAAPVRRPQNTYVPPKRDTTPSWRKKPKDTLPGY